MQDLSLIHILLDAGVIDPTKVVRTALQNAASVASLMPVSYTHLDVYKRQRPDRAGMDSLTRRPRPG